MKAGPYNSPNSIEPFVYQGGVNIIQEKLFDTGSVSINYAKGPKSGTPLILLHGLPGRWQEFLPIIPTLATRWHIYALDSRGQGKSGRTTGAYRPEHYVADITAFLEKQISEPAVIVGMSAAGVAVLAAAAQLQQKVRALVIGDSPLDMEALISWMSLEAFARHFTSIQELAGSKLSVPQLAQALGELPVRLSGLDEPPLYKEMPGMDAAHLRAWAKTTSQLDPDVLAYHATGRGKEFLDGIDMDAILQRVTCPTLLIRANPQLGALLSAAAAEHALSILPNAVQVLLEPVGHNLGLDTWEVGPLLRAFTDFTESL